MRVVQLTAYRVKLPLKKEIKHASATRRESENLVVCVRLENGITGWGEGVPRPYVTGESPAGAMQQLAATDLEAQLGKDCHTWEEVFAMCEGFAPVTTAAVESSEHCEATAGMLTQEAAEERGCSANALRCAVELALLDAFGKHWQKPLFELTKLYPPAEPIRKEPEQVRYSTAITAESSRKEIVSALKMRLFNFHQCKVKVGFSPEKDARRLRRIRRILGPGVDIRVDANEAWPLGEVVERMSLLKRASISSVEQPVAHAEVGGLSDVRQELKVPIMLDESLTGTFDAERAIREGMCDLFNLRLSKCGGFLACLRLAALAHANGLGYQLGCHPGESGILSAAGRHFACTVTMIRYLEGSYDRFILQENLTKKHVSFRYSGKAVVIMEPGLGVSVEPQTVHRLSSEQKNWRWGDVE
ncbi:Muconate cycloisomerase I [Planctomycetales bacterium 10988]|nr:Muconate cycloisomerase I [Planctomycetales bacterium 10988]